VLTPSQAGFGLGALNEAEDDDIDVYDSGVNRGRTQMAYDAMDQDDREDIIMGGPSRERGSRPGPSLLVRTLARAPRSIHA
jgi:G patch domain-containing protein 1